MNSQDTNGLAADGYDLQPVSGKNYPENRPENYSGDDCVISIRSLWKVFGKNPQKVLAEDTSTLDKSDILERLGCVVALQDTSFDVGKGETFVVMGLSGSGKSTLVRCLIRLIEPTAGRILVDNEDILEYRESDLMEFRRTKVSMVFQHYGLLPHRSVLETAAYGLEVRGVDLDERLARASDMLANVGLSGWENASPNELSGGMQQRVGLARALTVDPAILLMDEPFSGLDPLIRRQMREELALLQEELKKTIVFITHDLDEAITVGDRIAIMRDGKIIQLGTPEDIVGNPADEFVQEFTRGISKTRVLSISHIMKEPDTLVSKDDSPHSVLQALNASGQTAACIVGEDSQFVGVATKANVSPAVANNSPSLDDVDTDTPQAVLSTTPIDEALPLVLGHEMPIPITDDQGRLVGVATQQDILKIVAQCSREQQTLASAPIFVA